MNDHVIDRLDARLASANKQLDAKNVDIGRLNDDVMRLTKALESREKTIKELRNPWSDDLEAMPEYPISALVWHIDGFVTVTVKGSGEFDYDEDELCPISHWAPLPPPPTSASVKT